MDPNLVAAVQSIAESLKSRDWPPNTGDLAQLALCVLTLVTCWLLKRYTDETTKLRIATADQVEINNQLLQATKQQIALSTELLKATQEQATASTQLLEETKAQNEVAWRPMIVLAITGGQNGYGQFVLKNVGNGPALNTSTIQIGQDPPSWNVTHQSLVAHGESEPMTLHLASMAASYDPADLTRFLITYMGKEDGRNEGLYLETVYRDINGVEYVSSQGVFLKDERDGLKIRFGDFQRLKEPK